MASLKPQELPNLNALRGIAALSVFFFHQITLFTRPGPLAENPVYEVLDMVLNKGFQGVSFFFVLSGFLIVWLACREFDRSGSFHSGKFVMRRILRIWPVYFITVLVLFLVIPPLIQEEVPYSPGRFSLFLANFDEILSGADSNLNMYTVLWSVSVEEQFYVAFALLMLIAPLRKPGNLAVLLSLVVIGSQVFRFANAGDARVNYYHTLAVMSDLAVGGLLAIAYFRKHGLVAWIGRLPDSLALAVLAAGSFWVIAQHTILPVSLYPLDRLLTSFFWAFVIAHQVTRTGGWLQAGRIPGLTYAGKVSYGFYMYHVLVLWLVGETVVTGISGQQLGALVGNTLIALGGTLALSTVSFELMEKPVLRLRSRFR
jgi:peptidoglycan/LPS O-acetylase OafA/YrhL